MVFSFIPCIYSLVDRELSDNVGIISLPPASFILQCLRLFVYKSVQHLLLLASSKNKFEWKPGHHDSCEPFANWM